MSNPKKTAAVSRRPVAPQTVADLDAAIHGGEPAVAVASPSAPAEVTGDTKSSTVRTVRKSRADTESRSIRSVQVDIPPAEPEAELRIPFTNNLPETLFREWFTYCYWEREKLGDVIEEALKIVLKDKPAARKKLPPKQQAILEGKIKKIHDRRQK